MKQISLPEAHIASEGRQSHKEIHFPSVDFQVQAVFFREVTYPGSEIMNQTVHQEMAQLPWIGLYIYIVPFFKPTFSGLYQTTSGGSVGALDHEICCSFISSARGRCVASGGPGSPQGERAHAGVETVWAVDARTRKFMEKDGN